MIVPGRRRLEVEHTSEFCYRKAARGSLLTLRLRPREDGHQRLLDFSLEVSPIAVPITFADSFGNVCHLVNMHRQHRRITVRSLSLVEVSDPLDSPGRGEAPSWEALAEAADPVRYWEYMNPSRLAHPCAALESFVAAHGICRGPDPVASLRDTASILHKAFIYEPGSTEVHSPIGHVLETGRGVCQDYTHVMLAITRSWGIPSRYVSGYLHSEGVSGEQSTGSASHAWAEFLLPGMGWVGVDPTNNTFADHRHIPVATGRDYADAAPTRGTVLGGGESSLDVRVSVVESNKPGPRAPIRIERVALHHLAATPPAQKTAPGQGDQ